MNATTTDRRSVSRLAPKTPERRRFEYELPVQTSTCLPPPGACLLTLFARDHGSTELTPQFFITDALLLVTQVEHHYAAAAHEMPRLAPHHTELVKAGWSYECTLTTTRCLVDDGWGGFTEEPYPEDGGRVYCPSRPTGQALRDALAGIVRENCHCFGLGSQDDEPGVHRIVALALANSKPVA